MQIVESKVATAQASLISREPSHRSLPFCDPSPTHDGCCCYNTILRTRRSLQHHSLLCDNNNNNSPLLLAFPPVRVRSKESNNRPFLSQYPPLTDSFLPSFYSPQFRQKLAAVCSIASVPSRPAPLGTCSLEKPQPRILHYYFDVHVLLPSVV